LSRAAIQDSIVLKIFFFHVFASMIEIIYNFYSELSLYKNELRHFEA